MVRYGERVLYEFDDEETNEHVVYHVADFIRYDLERDDLSFYTPVFKRMLNEAADHCGEENFVASRYFLSHPDQLVSRIAVNLISEKYQLSKYHTKYQQIETEEDRLDQYVTQDLFAFKEAYILKRIKEKQDELKNITPDDVDKMLSVMKDLSKLNEIKKVLSKELGERIVLKM